MLNHDVTQASIQDTICRKGFTKTIRPAVVYTNGLKFKLMRVAGIPEEDADKYQLDHTVPLAVGGHHKGLAGLRLSALSKMLNRVRRDLSKARIKLYAGERRAVRDTQSPLQGGRPINSLDNEGES